MTDPTKGPFFVDGDQVWHENGLACIAEAYSGVAAQAEPDQDQQFINAVLICAAFNAAQKAKEMGFDPIGAIEALPELLNALANTVHHFDGEAEDMYEARSALKAARTRKE